MVNYYLTIMARSEFSDEEAEKYIQTKVPAIWRKQVRDKWNAVLDKEIFLT